MCKEAIVLAGGLGTRLRETVPDLPKCMAPVAGRPFLFYVINYLRSQGIEKFIFSVGYKHETIEKYLEEEFATLNYECVVETEPLGTGGAVKLALSKANSKDILIANGDTIFKADLNELKLIHLKKESDCSIALKPMNDFDRYGAVMLSNDQSISGFTEKKYYQSGNINGGIYLLNREKFEKTNLPEKFSFETEYLEKFCKEQRFYGIVQDKYFIDIGIPEDYERAQKELAKAPLDMNSIDSSWSLFLDRDGVINHEKENDYIRHWDQFVFYTGVKEAIKKLAEKFGNIFIISNQRGVERGFLTESVLSEIHKNMIQEIEETGGRIDKIYFCTAIDDKHPDRKPNPGMAFRAKKEFPEIDLSKAIMVGNKPGDIMFGHHAGMYSVFIKSTHPELSPAGADLVFDSLAEFANAL